MDEYKSNVDTHTGIVTENTELLSRINLSRLVVDCNLFKNPFQSSEKRKYNYGAL